MPFTPPRPTEYGPFYAGYIARVASEDVMSRLHAQTATIQQVFAGLTEDQSLFRYAEGKWSVKEVLGHLTDAERIFSYRALRIARGDRTPLAGFDENAYVAAAHFDARPLAELMEEWTRARAATLPLLRSFGPEEIDRVGSANGVEISTRAIAYILAGHVEHHLDVLRTRYGRAAP